MIIIGSRPTKANIMNLWSDRNCLENNFAFGNINSEPIADNCEMIFPLLGTLYLRFARFRYKPTVCSRLSPTAIALSCFSICPLFTYESSVFSSYGPNRWAFLMTYIFIIVYLLIILVSIDSNPPRNIKTYQVCTYTCYLLFRILDRFFVS